MLEKKKLNEDEFAKTYKMLQENEKNMSSFDYNSLLNLYNGAKRDNSINNFFDWLYHNTPFGPHPSPEYRIKAANDYLNSEASKN